MIKYAFRRQFKRIREDQLLYWEEWSEELFPNKEELEKKLKLEIAEDRKEIQYKWLATVDYEIKEVNLKNLEFEGIVHDYGEYEDYTVAVGDIQIERLIINKFRGQKIRVTIEVLE